MSITSENHTTGGAHIKVSFREEIFRSIQDMVDRAVANSKADRTYRSVVKRVVPKGYVVLDESGCERTVPCCIPGIELKNGQNVWLKVPLNDLKGLHICGIV